MQIRLTRFAVHCAIATVLVAMVPSASAAAAPPRPANDALPGDLRRAADAYDAAQIHGDKAALERLVADDYVLVNSGAEVQGKAELIAGYTAPGSSLKPYVVEDPIQKVFGDSAVLAGEVALEGVEGGKPFKGRIRYADVWRKRKDGWVVVFTEVTRVPAR